MIGCVLCKQGPIGGDLAESLAWGLNWTMRVGWVRLTCQLPYASFLFAIFNFLEGNLSWQSD